MGWGYCPSLTFVDGMLLNSCMSLECAKTTITEKSRRKKFSRYKLCKNLGTQRGRQLKKVDDKILQLSCLCLCLIEYERDTPKNTLV